MWPFLFKPYFKVIHFLSIIISCSDTTIKLQCEVNKISRLSILERERKKTHSQIHSNIYNLGAYDKEMLLEMHHFVPLLSEEMPFITVNRRQIPFVTYPGIPRVPIQSDRGTPSGRSGAFKVFLPGTTAWVTQPALTKTCSPTLVFASLLSITLNDKKKIRNNNNMKVVILVIVLLGSEIILVPF